MNQLLPIGTEVIHCIRGAGIIIAYNTTDIFNALYNGYGYPYVVQFPDGYSDYYAHSDLISLE